MDFYDEYDDYDEEVMSPSDTSDEKVHDLKLNEGVHFYEIGYSDRARSGSPE